MLGPPLYIIYTSELGLLLTAHDVLYADDIQASFNSLGLQLKCSSSGCEEIIGESSNRAIGLYRLTD